MTSPLNPRRKGLLGLCAGVPIVNVHRVHRVHYARTDGPRNWSVKCAPIPRLDPPFSVPDPYMYRCTGVPVELRQRYVPLEIGYNNAKEVSLHQRNHRATLPTSSRSTIAPVAAHPVVVFPVGHRLRQAFISLYWSNGDHKP